MSYGNDSHVHPMLIDIEPYEDRAYIEDSPMELSAGTILFEKKEEPGKNAQNYFNQLTNPAIKPAPPRWWVVYNDIETNQKQMYPMNAEQATEIVFYLDMIAEEETNMKELIEFLCM